MKKLITLCFSLLLLVGVAHAQFGSGVLLPLAVGDTILNTTTVTKTISATGGYSGAVIQVETTSQTGTRAAVARVFGSVDNGVTYDRLRDQPFATPDSVILSATTAHYTFKLHGPLPPKIQVQVQGSGTQATLVQVWYVLRKYQNN